MNSEYIKEELNLLIKDGLILEYKIIENYFSNHDYKCSEAKNIFITTIEYNKLEVTINENFCYKLKSINEKNIENNEDDKDIYEDLSILIEKYSPNFRIKFNEILNEKLSKLKDNNE